MTQEKKSSSFKPKYVLIPGLIIFIGGIFAGLGIMFTSFLPIGDPMDLSKLWLGLEIMGGAMGFIMFIFMPLMFFSVTRRRTNLLSSFQMSKIGPYAPGYKPTPNVKKVSFCEYCGYQVEENERECPQCGGPVRSLKSTYI